MYERFNLIITMPAFTLLFVISFTYVLGFLCFFLLLYYFFFVLNIFHSIPFHSILVSSPLSFSKSFLSGFPKSYN